MKKPSRPLRELLLDDILSRAGLFASAVHPLYGALGWTWGEGGIPTVLDIKNHIKETVHKMKEDNSMSHDSGGLKIEFEFDGLWQLHLSFVFETTVYASESLRGN